MSPVNSFHLRTPFYIGTAGLGLDLFSYNNKVNPEVEVISGNVSVFFGFTPIKNNTLILSLGTLIGVQVIENYSNFSANNITESELFTGYTIEPQIKLRNVVLFTEFQYRRVYYYYRQTFFSVGIGIKYRIEIGENLRRFLD